MTLKGIIPFLYKDDDYTGEKLNKSTSIGHNG